MQRFFIILLFFFFNSMYLNAQEKESKSKKALKKDIETNNSLGDYIEALSYLKQLYEQDTMNLKTLYKYAQTLKEYKDYINAEKKFTELVLKDEKNKYAPYATFELGQLKKHNKKYLEAISVFKKAFEQNRSVQDNYIQQKTKREIESCQFAINGQKDSLEFKVSKLDSTINSKNSEFIHTIKDNKIIFSSLRPDSIDKNEVIYSKTYLNKLFAYDTITRKTNEIKELNFEKQNTSNGTFSIYGNRFFYSVCDTNYLNTKCKIVSVSFRNNKFGVIDTLYGEINSEDGSFSMPYVTKINGKEIIFYCSNDNSGKGGYDIYAGELVLNQVINSKPVPAINSLENEITPFYDTITNELYFSSTWHNGFGGYDVFKVNYIKPTKNSIINLGPVVNSPANETYFFKNKNEFYFTSNRLGSNFSKNPTCCGDIYKAEKNTPKKALNKDSIIPNITLSKNTIDSLKLKVEIEQKIEARKIEQKENYIQLTKLLPLTLYFHNDEPNPKSNDTTSNFDYEETYHKYIELLPRYQSEYSKDLKKEKKIEAEEDILNFFSDKVINGYNQLNEFLNLLEIELKQGTYFKLEIKGFASPLAKTKYNRNLSKRRIDTFKNYIRTYNSGVLMDYYKNKKTLEIIEVPFGEEKADHFVSDNPNDTKKSVYSKAASLERKIEILSVEIVK